MANTVDESLYGNDGYPRVGEVWEVMQADGSVFGPVVIITVNRDYVEAVGQRSTDSFSPVLLTDVFHAHVVHFRGRRLFTREEHRAMNAFDPDGHRLPRKGDMYFDPMSIEHQDSLSKDELVAIEKGQVDFLEHHFEEYIERFFVLRVRGDVVYFIDCYDGALLLSESSKNVNDVLVCSGDYDLIDLDHVKGLSDFLSFDMNLMYVWDFIKSFELAERKDPVGVAMRDVEKRAIAHGRGWTLTYPTQESYEYAQQLVDEMKRAIPDAF